jgi:putative tryptophan/tyrosine transport system substrate-binding protein
MNHRRQLVLGLSVSALLPWQAFAQKPAVVRIGWVSNDRAVGSPFLDAVREGLRDFGYVEGRNLVIDARWGDGSIQRIDQLAADLVRSKPQVIVTHGGPSTYPVRRAGATMPVVFVFSGDPVAGGLVDSFARPGRNFTGISLMSTELIGKRMALLKEVIPSLRRVAVCSNPEHPGAQSELRASEAAAKSLGLVVEHFQVRTRAELEDMLPFVLTSRSEAIVVFPDAILMRYSEHIAEFAIKNRIPAMSGWALFAERGNLMSYGPNLRDSYRRVAFYVDKIVKGANPAELPIELPTTVEFVVNLKAAKALGITIPQSVALRTDRVIE